MRTLTFCIGQWSLPKGPPPPKQRSSTDSSAASLMPPPEKDILSQEAYQGA
jgi:hypothetical protein